MFRQQWNITEHNGDIEEAEEKGKVTGKVFEKL